MYPSDLISSLHGISFKASCCSVSRNILVLLHLFFSQSLFTISRCLVSIHFLLLFSEYNSLSVILLFTTRDPGVFLSPALTSNNTTLTFHSSVLLLRPTRYSHVVLLFALSAFKQQCFSDTLFSLPEQEPLEWF